MEVGREAKAVRRANRSRRGSLKIFKVRAATNLLALTEGNRRRLVDKKGQ